MLFRSFYLPLGNYIARQDWESATQNYTSNNREEVKNIALNWIKLGNKDIYRDVFNLYNADNDLNLDEVFALCTLVKELDDTSGNYIDEIVKNVNNVNTVAEASKEICKLKSENTVGYELAFAIYDYQTQPSMSYAVLKKYQNDDDYREFLIILSNLLYEQKASEQIADNEGQTFSNIQKEIKSIKERLSQK